MTTKTTLRLDGRGNYHLSEENNQDNGRDVFLVDDTLAVGLKYGRLVARPARDPEPARYLEEAVSGVGAVWDLVARAAVLRRDPKASRVVLDVSLGPPNTDDRQTDGEAGKTVSKPGRASPAGRTTWQKTVQVTALKGWLALGPDPSVEEVHLEAEIGLIRDGTPLRGHLKVDFQVEQTDPGPIRLPEVHKVAWRHRTLLEEQDLLGEDHPIAAAKKQKKASARFSKSPSARPRGPRRRLNRSGSRPNPTGPGQLNRPPGMERRRERRREKRPDRRGRPGERDLQRGLDATNPRTGAADDGVIR